MFIVSNRNIILPGPNGERFHMPRGWMGTLPAWAEKSAYLAALAADGKVILSHSSGDKAVEEDGRRKRNRKPGDESAPADPGEPGTDGAE